MNRVRQLQISSSLLEELVVSAADVIGFVGPEGRTAITRLNKALSSASVILRASAGPATFSGSEIGDYHIDPTQSPFL